MTWLKIRQKYGLGGLMMIKATVHSIEPQPVDHNGDPRFCRVIPDNDAGTISLPLNIPWQWRRAFGNIQVGDRVFCLLDDNLEGCILQRIDGDWDFKIKNKSNIVFEKNVDIGGNATVQGDTETAGNATVQGNTQTAGNSTVQGKVTAADVTTAAVASLNAHTHTSADPGKPTSAPNG